MKKELAAANQVSFLDEWPQPPKCTDNDDLLDGPGLTQLKLWRLQTLLSVNPWGIPSLGLAEAYEKMFSKPLDIRDLGYDNLSDMVQKLSNIFTVQEPDDATALMFPDYPQDRILHDARIGHDFDKQHSPQIKDYKTLDPDALILYAWINRDDDFPPDVVLAGETYTDIILPMASANIQGTRGVHQAIMVGAANPEHFYINIKSELLDRVARLSSEISTYFKATQFPVEMYNVPPEFVYPGFPCLLYIEQEKCWERCAIVDRCSKNGKVLIETVDYGGVRTVDSNFLYLMPRQFFDIPRQGVLVSFIGLKPSDGGEKWSAAAGSRLRCFSNFNYWLDCLLVQPSRNGKKEDKLACDSGSLSSADGVVAANLSRSEKKRRLMREKIQYEIIICDRNDDEMDIYLDEILLLETYAISDDKRASEAEALREKLKKALKTIPRPNNPLV